MNISKILIGIDNSNYAQHAASYGFAMARTFNAVVGLVHIVEPGIMPPISTDTTSLDLTGLGVPVEGMNSPEMAQVMQAEDNAHKAILQHAIDQYGEGLQVSQLTDYGPTADGIINCSKEFGADLIVIGTHSRTGFDRFIMGSVAEKVIRESMIPVLVVPLKIDENEPNTTA